MQSARAWSTRPCSTPGTAWPRWQSSCQGASSVNRVRWLSQPCGCAVMRRTGVWACRWLSTGVGSTDRALRSTVDHTEVDGDLCAGHVPGFVTGQEGHQTGNVVGLEEVEREGVHEQRAELVLTFLDHGEQIGVVEHGGVHADG